MAFSYNKKNLANTTITGAISSSDTSITVDDATVFPSGYFYATLMPSSEMSTFSNSEIVLVTNISSNALTIARGQKNTTARAFSAGAIITNGVYTEDLDFAQSVGKKIFSATWGGQSSPYYKITDDMLKVVPDEGTSIRAIFDTDYASGTAKLSINESTSGVATVSGSNISITDAENLAPADVKFKGDTTQQTYSGINTAFLNQSLNTNYGSSNWTYISDTAEDVTATKLSGGGKFFAAFEANVVSGKTYRLKGYAEASSGTVAIYGYQDRTWGTPAYPAMPYLGTGVIDTTFTSNYTGKYVFAAYSDDAVGATVSVKNIMFGENVQSTSPYEPYVGGNPSPSPDYPQTVQTVTGEQTITITDGGGQSQEYKINLGGEEFEPSDITAGVYFDSTGTAVWNDGWCASDYMPVEAGREYTYSGITVAGEAPYSVYYDADKHKVSTFKQATGTNDITIPSGIAYVRFSLRNASPNIDKDTFSFKLKGVEIELCKLGDYQDYIYKDNGNWYIHKEVQRVLLDGSEYWELGTTKTKTQIFSHYIGQFISGQYYSNRFLYPFPSGTDTEGLVMLSPMMYMGLSKTTASTVAQCKAWLTSNPVVVYYPLSTATDTQITDTTLISQLNALANNKLYAGTNNIVVTGGLDGILEVQYYRSGSGVNLVPVVTGARIQDKGMSVGAKLKRGQPYTLTYSNGYWYAMNVTDTTFEDEYAYRPGDTITSPNYEIYMGFGRGANSKTKAVLYLTLSKPIIDVSSVTISWGQYALDFFDIESGTKVFADPGSVTATQFTANGLQFMVEFPTPFTTGGNYEYGFFTLGEPTITFNASNNSRSAGLQSEEIIEKPEEPIEEQQDR
jgi:hypothetical protein